MSEDNTAVVGMLEVMKRIFSLQKNSLLSDVAVGQQGHAGTITLIFSDVKTSRVLTEKIHFDTDCEFNYNRVLEKIDNANHAAHKIFC